ncbi:hypothetical protein AXG93_2490s1510 [Marchantia polymorpha subsp. ruderalis]|uniref:HAT C-terminal dimerisation domain-containing protein n=1 Tax=Marchantia polymorpha subsp. ruderalis TaxID=1480154 RepID=A0A176W5Q0_MARPO|nr:hypothetical protein AXG93_2490s1510 [Marchantia polymorpha subsp. ruderalis]
MIADSKALVTYMKQTYLNRELKHKMKQDVPTRFDGLLIMLQSVTAKLDETINLLKKKKHENRAEKIYAQVLEELIQLLDYFKLASNSLEPFNTLTLHLLGIWLANQKTHLQPRDELVSVDGANGKRRTSLTKTNSVKRPHTVVFNIGPDREYSDDNESVEDHDEPVKDSQLEAPIDVKLAEYRLLKVFKNDKVILLQPDTWKKARSNGDIKHDVGLLPWWQLRSTKYPILARAVQAILWQSSRKQWQEVDTSVALYSKGSIGRRGTGVCGRYSQPRHLARSHGKDNREPATKRKPGYGRKWKKQGGNGSTSYAGMMLTASKGRGTAISSKLATEWILDSGCSHRMIGIEILFLSLKDLPKAKHLAMMTRLMPLQWDL